MDTSSLVKMAKKVTEYIHEHPETWIALSLAYRVTNRTEDKKYEILRHSYMEFNRRVRNAKIACVRAGISYDTTIEEV